MEENLSYECGSLEIAVHTHIKTILLVFYLYFEKYFIHLNEVYIFIVHN
jgi:hypothetical protein